MCKIEETAQLPVPVSFAWQAMNSPAFLQALVQDRGSVDFERPDENGMLTRGSEIRASLQLEPIYDSLNSSAATRPAIPVLRLLFHDSAHLTLHMRRHDSENHRAELRLTRGLPGARLARVALGYKLLPHRENTLHTFVKAQLDIAPVVPIPDGARPALHLGLARIINHNLLGGTEHAA